MDSLGENTLLFNFQLKKKFWQCNFLDTQSQAQEVCALWILITIEKVDLTHYNQTLHSVPDFIQRQLVNALFLSSVMLLNRPMVSLLILLLVGNKVSVSL